MRYLAMGLVMAAASIAQDQAPNRLVVHEWGTFTSVAGGDGASVEWRPLSGPSDLPTFVYTLDKMPRGLRHGTQCAVCGEYNCDSKYCKGGRTKAGPAAIRMETPVLYFYADREIDVNVRVDFPKGRITEWYPQARSLGNPDVKNQAVSLGKFIDWGKVKVMPGAQVEFPREKAESHYYPARETDAAPVRVCAAAKPEVEKFLFYRGLGTFDLPIRVRQADGFVEVLRHIGKDPISHIVLFENRAGQVRFTTHRDFHHRVDLKLPQAAGERPALLAELEKMLVDQGLYEKEARAMIQTWRDSWFEEGTRVFYIVPRLVTDAVLPLQIYPKPAELVRVLVGRVEIISPEMEKEILSHVSALGHEDFQVREAATAALRKYGRFLEPALKKVRESVEDPEIRSRIDELLKF